VAPPPPPPPMASSSAASAHQRNMSNSSVASSGSSGSLRLSNYASPTSPVPLGGSSNRNSISRVLGPVIGGHPISPGPPALDVQTRRGDWPVQRRSPNNSFSSMTPSTSSSITPTPTSVGAPFTPVGTDRPPSPSAFTNAKANGSSSPPFSTADRTYAALVEKWCFHQSPPPSKDVSPSVEMSAPNLGVPNGSMNSLGVPGGFEAGAAGYGSAYGYAHHHQNPLSLAMKP